MSENRECLTFEEALQRLEDERIALSSADLYALSGASSAENQLFARRWPRIPVNRRRTVIAMLVDNAETNFELDFNALFRLMMKDEDDEVRALSIDGLWEDEEVTLIAPLVQVLGNDPAEGPRAAAASSLGRFVLMADLEEIEERYAGLLQGALLKVIRNVDEGLEVRRRAVESIAYSSESCVQDVIAHAYADADERMRISAVYAMGRSADKAWSDAALKELSSTNPAMRYEAARACGELEVSNAVPALVQLIADPDREVQAAAIAALGQIGGPRARRALERCLRSDVEVVSMAAEDALAELELGQQPLDMLVCDGLAPSYADEDAEEDEELESDD
jgi:HEAT repeat protein